MDRNWLLTILISITLAICIVNLYAIVNLTLNLGKFAQRMAAAKQPFPTPPFPQKFDRGAFPAPGQETRAPAKTENDIVKGSPSAPVTIIEFSDYQCPFSARFFSQTLPQIDKDYIKTGKVKFAYRDYPLAFHQSAQKAAEASECSHEQGKFWEYHDTLFENQQALDVASLKKYAKDLKLDTQKFNSCLDSGKMASEVQADFKDGSSYGVSGTPCFFVNGLRISGALPYEAFKEAIEKELKKK